MDDTAIIGRENTKPLKIWSGEEEEEQQVRVGKSHKELEVEENVRLLPQLETYKKI